MQIEERNNYIALFDIYGKMLSKKQYEVMDKFLNLDLSESELAELSGETRQSVHDAIVKAKKQLTEFEEKLNISNFNESLKNSLLAVKNNIESEHFNKTNALEKINEIINKF